MSNVQLSALLRRLRRAQKRPGPRLPATPASLGRARRRLRRAGLESVGCEPLFGAIHLTGYVDSWAQRVAAGHIAASVLCRGVVNDLSVANVVEEGMTLPRKSDATLHGREYDVVVIGGGVIGCSIARELSRHDLRIALLEKEDDVGCHSSGRNDGMIHPGFGPKPGTLKAWYNTAGNRLYESTAAELGFRFERVGSIMLFSSPWLRLLLPLMWRRVRLNRVDGPVRFLSRSEVRKREPRVTARQHGGLFFPSTGIVNPFEVTIAYAENAAANGVEFHFETVAHGFEFGRRGEERSVSAIRTNRGTIRTAAVVNAAGNWADTVAALADDRFFTIHGRRGVDVVLDKRLSGSQRQALAMPTLLGRSGTHTKGGGLIPSIDGNLIAGPTSEETPHRESYSTTNAEFNQVTGQLGLNETVSSESVITYFAGVRPATFTEDFIVEPSRCVRNLIHVAGIQSPGLASAPAIAVDAAGLAVAAIECETGRQPRANPAFDPRRPARPNLSGLSLTQRARLLADRPDYARQVCRCEDVSEGEIRDALRSPLRVESLDAVKRRTRAGSGRCHGGYCLPKLLEIIGDETGLPLEAIRKKSGNSYLVAGRTKEIRGSAVNG